MLIAGKERFEMSESEKQSQDGSTSSKRRLPRREWLTAFAAGGVVTAGATLGYESCEVQPRDPDAPELELEYIQMAVQPLGEIDYVAEGKRRGLLAEDIRKELAGDINEYLSTTYRAFVYSELVNSLSEDLRKTEEVQSDIAKMSPVLDQAVADAYYIIGMADEETRKLIDQELRDDPDAVMDMASFLDEEGSRRGLGLRGRLRLRRASRQLSARIRMQSADEFMTELTDQITRFAERNAARSEGTDFGVSRAAQRMVAQYDDPFASDIRPRPDDEKKELPKYTAAPGDARLRELQAKERSLTAAARGLAGAGGALLIAGGIALGASGGLGGAFVMCAGGFILLIALFVAAALGRRRRQLRDATDSAKPTVVP